MSDASTTRARAEAVAAQLGEVDEVPIGAIQRMAKVLGADVVEDLCREALAIEAAGGEHAEVSEIATDEHGTPRRRTPGGIFFRLAKARLPRAIRRHVFYGTRLGPKDPPAPPPPPAPVETPKPSGPVVIYARRRQSPRAASEGGV